MPRYSSKNIGFNTGLRIDGDIVKLKALVEAHPYIISQATILGKYKAAKKFQKFLKQMIREGGRRFGYPPLSPDYLSRKLAAGAPITPFILTRSFHDSIQVNQTKNHQTYVGIPKNYRRRASKYSNKRPLIGKYMEKNLKSRPIIRDSWNKFKGVKVLKREVVKQLMIAYAVLGIKPRVQDV